MSGKMPPGQRYISSWPVRTAEDAPDIDPKDWTLEITGLIKTPKTLSIEEIHAMPTVEVKADFHCVETWTVPDNVWKGVRVRDLIDESELQQDAKFALFHSPGGYSSEIDLECLMDDETILAWERNGEPIPFGHGYPLRLIVPSRYAYKSVKWVNKIEFVDKDIRGYWEARGYHPVADVWKNERYG
jgi:DMSO/TMAO reductase YedYZ molybdopterin-dependent catalytic subunit